MTRNFSHKIIFVKSYKRDHIRFRQSILNDIQLIDYNINIEYKFV